MNNKGVSINYVNFQVGGGVTHMSTIQRKLMLWTSHWRRGGGKNHQKSVNVVYGFPIMHAEWCLWLIHCILVIIGFDTFGWSIYFSYNITPQYWHYHSHLWTKFRVGMNSPISYFGFKSIIFEIGFTLKHFEFIAHSFYKGKNIVIKQTYAYRIW